MYKLLIFLWVLCIIPVTAVAKHKHTERWYQEKWCTEITGKPSVDVTEIRLYKDDIYLGRVDCLTNHYAIEFDFAEKWAESFGQANLYSIITGRYPAVVLILEEEKDIKHVKKLKMLSEETSHIKIFIIDNIHNNYN